MFLIRNGSLGLGTLAGIIVGCVALLALISVVSAFCYWWKSTGRENDPGTIMVWKTPAPA